MPVDKRSNLFVKSGKPPSSPFPENGREALISNNSCPALIGPPQALQEGRHEVEVHCDHLHRLLEEQRGVGAGVGVQRLLRPRLGEQGKDVR